MIEFYDQRKLVIVNTVFGNRTLPIRVRTLGEEKEGKKKQKYQGTRIRRQIDNKLLGNHIKRVPTVCSILGSYISYYFYSKKCNNLLTCNFLMDLDDCKINNNNALWLRLEKRGWMGVVMVSVIDT